MTESKSKSKRKKRKYSRLGNLCWAASKLWKLDRWFVFFIFVKFIPEILDELASSFFPGHLIDLLGTGADFKKLLLYCAGFSFLLLLLRQLQSLIGLKCQGRRYYPTSCYQVEMDVKREYELDYENTFKQDYREIENYAMGDACSGNCALEFFWQDLSSGLYHVGSIVMYVSFLTVLNPLLMAVVAAVSVFSYFTTRWQSVYYEKNKHKWEKDVRKKDYLKGLSGNFSLAKDIKLYGLEDWLDKMMRKYQASIFSWNKRCSLRGFWSRALYALMDLLQHGTVYFVLIGILLNGGITVGEFVFYFNMLFQLGGHFEGIIRTFAQLNTRAEKIAYYREFYDYPNVFNHGQGCQLPSGPVTIELRNVWYRYDGAGEDTLKGINLMIRGGEKLALVGMNGAGKTTMIKLICGLFIPSRGEILVNGRKIQEYNIEEYYSLISAVFQEVHPMALTIFEYVASFDPERSGAREDAVSAMQAAGIYDKVRTLPEGMDTHLMKGIYDDGVDFSGGEMQKLVLARAIYKDGPVLVLDEPTAALDPIAENNLYLQYRELTKGKTSIYISHRFASTRFCDRIVLLENGRVTEEGSHEELMKRNGSYAHMFRVQSQYYKTAEVQPNQ